MKGLGLALALGLAASPAAAADHPNALWRVVHDLCLRDARFIGQPAPCLAVNRQGGYAVVPDPKGRTQVLLVPTRRIAGIESPELRRPGGPNYWQAAWTARRFVEARAGRSAPREAIGMAINSAGSRSQEQLHIHVDCLRPDVQGALRAHTPQIGPAWTTLRAPVAGQRWQVRRLTGAELGTRDPFKLLARGVTGARADMARRTLVVAGATFGDGSSGFYLLSREGDAAFGEALLDHRCTLLKQNPRLTGGVRRGM